MERNRSKKTKRKIRKTTERLNDRWKEIAEKKKRKEERRNRRERRRRGNNKKKTNREEEKKDERANLKYLKND